MTVSGSIIQGAPKRRFFFLPVNGDSKSKYPFLILLTRLLHLGQNILEGKTVDHAP